MGLRDFLEQVPFVCTEDKVLAKRIARDMLLKYDYELASEDSEFAMKSSDFKTPLERIEMAFLSKHLDKVDYKKMQRAEDLVYLLSLGSYRDKYNMYEYDKEIEVLSTQIAAEPIPEVDSLMSTSEAAKGAWSD